MTKKKPSPKKPWEKRQGVLFPEEVKELDKLREYLCTLAHVPRTSTVNVEGCRKCRLCGYGREYVRRWDALKKKEKEEPQMPTSKRPVNELTLEETLEQERKRCEELNESNVRLVNSLQLAEKKLEEANRRATEEHIEAEVLKMTVIRLKARMFDMEHPENDF